MTQLMDNLVAIIGRNQPIAANEAIALAQDPAWRADQQAQLVERLRLEKADSAGFCGQGLGLVKKQLRTFCL